MAVYKHPDYDEVIISVLHELAHLRGIQDEGKAEDFARSLYARVSETFFTSPKMPQGQCYQDAVKYVMDHPDWTLVHGVIERPYSGPVLHAWAEKNDLVWEPQSGQTLSKTDWDKHVISRDAEYTAREGLKLIVGTRNYGPWTEEERRGLRSSDSEVVFNPTVKPRPDNQVETLITPRVNVLTMLESPPMPSLPQLKGTCTADCIRKHAIVARGLLEETMEGWRRRDVLTERERRKVERVEQELEHISQLHGLSGGERYAGIVKKANEIRKALEDTKMGYVHSDIPHTGTMDDLLKARSGIEEILGEIYDIIAEQGEMSFSETMVSFMEQGIEGDALGSEVCGVCAGGVFIPADELNTISDTLLLAKTVPHIEAVQKAAREELVILEEKYRDDLERHGIRKVPMEFVEGTEIDRFNLLGYKVNSKFMGFVLHRQPDKIYLVPENVLTPESARRTVRHEFKHVLDLTGGCPTCSQNERESRARSFEVAAKVAACPSCITPDGLNARIDQELACCDAKVVAKTWEGVDADPTVQEALDATADAQEAPTREDITALVEGWFYERNPEKSVGGGLYLKEVHMGSLQLLIGRIANWMRAQPTARLWVVTENYQGLTQNIWVFRKEFDARLWESKRELKHRDDGDAFDWIVTLMAVPFNEAYVPGGEEDWTPPPMEGLSPKAPHEAAYNSFGHFGVMVKNPDFIIRFRGEEWGHLGPLERELLFSGIMYMNEITVGQITEYAEKWRNEVVEVEQTSTGEIERHKLSDIAGNPDWTPPSIQGKTADAQIGHVHKSDESALDRANFALGLIEREFKEAMREKVSYNAGQNLLRAIKELEQAKQEAASQTTLHMVYDVEEKIKNIILEELRDALEPQFGRR